MSWSLLSHVLNSKLILEPQIGVFAITPIFSADLAKLYLCFPPLIPYLRGQYFSVHRLVYVREAAECNGHPDGGGGGGEHLHRSRVYFTYFPIFHARKPKAASTKVFELCLGPSRYDVHTEGEGYLSTITGNTSNLQTKI